MSQFRSRLPGNTPFTTDKGADQGYCCDSNGTGNYTTSTRYGCFIKNGFFIPGGVEADAKNLCPKVEKGKCCVYNSTTPRTLVRTDTGVTFCACSSNNPFYSGFLVSYTGPSNTCESTKSSFAPENGACCYWKSTANGYINQCQTVDNIDVCSSLHEGTAEGLRFSFYLGESCAIDGGNIICNSGKGLTETEKENNPNCMTDTSDDCFLQENILGNCCTLLNDDSRQCDITTKRDCAGFWSYLGAVRGCSGSTLCSGVYFPERSGTQYIPTTASISVLTNSVNPIEKLPSEISVYQGGLYLGIFEPGSTINISGSLVYGNTTTGNAINYRARGTGEGTRNKRWILIAALTDSLVDTRGNIINSSKNSSTYDGFYNTDQKNVDYFSGIRSLEINGFSDWYIPSQDELAFFFKTITSDFSMSGYTPLSQNYYLTSTNYGVGSNNTLTPIGDKYFTYVQSGISDQYGKVILMPQDNLNCKVRLFRRIYLGS